MASGSRRSARCRHPGFACRRICAAPALDPDALPRIADRTMAENAAALRRGELDVVQAVPALCRGVDRLRRRAISGTPPRPAARPHTRAFTRVAACSSSRRDEFKKLVRGLYRTQKWLHRPVAQDARRCGAVVLSGCAANPLRAAVARYQALGIWGRNPILPRGGYDRLKAGLVSGRFRQCRRAVRDRRSTTASPRKSSARTRRRWNNRQRPSGIGGRTY